MRFLMYAHNTTGFGHVQRLSRIAAKIREVDPEASVMIATGARRQLDSIVPEDIELVKLPGLKATLLAGRLERIPGALNLPLSLVIGIRVALLRAVLHSYDPDVFLVDHQPAGVAQELVALINEASKKGRPRLVFGMRGFHQVDAGRKIFNSEVNALLLRTCYDKLLIYSDPKVVDVARLFTVQSDIAERLEYVGYVAPDPAPPSSRPTRRGRKKGIHVLAIGGGGWLSEPVYRKVMDVSALDREIDLRIVTGPYLDAESYESLAGLPRRRCSIVEFTSDIQKEFAWADVIVCRAGYNTLAEVMAWGARAVCIPREIPDNEQLLHAKRLSQMGVIQLVREDAPAMDLLAAIRRSGNRALRAETPALDGARNTAKLLALLGRSRGVTPQ